MAVVVCVECGERSPQGVQFCGECGAFLDWDTASTEPEAPPAQAPASQSAVPQAPRAEEAAPGPAAVPIEADRPSETPEAVRPGETRTRRHVVVPPEPRPLGADEQPCPRCAAGNTLGRRFCRACGAPLTEAAAPPRLSWWRRWRARWTARRVHDAGTRRRVRGGPGTARMVWTVLLAALAVTAVMAVPTGLLRRADDAVRDRFTASFRLAARAGEASSAARGAAPANLVDGKSNRYWAPTGKPVGAWVELVFAERVRLLRVIVTAGVSSDPERFAHQGRPGELKAVVLTGSGPAPAQTLALRDQPGPQYFDLRVSDATGIRLTVMSTYGMAPARVCALAELEFDARR
ncbi:NADase-type glycan-binding domain-containing protein [Couchioplanes azureus]|uniref:NADase-type glycan-binding domain-containing protein n=1 Tax=Couchioplanes caeruleus TaxID=56438 RepID=UPI001670233F|nr:zinc ribbon domain-containing protein [Couchioplanes caeruleus]GGQ82458.1 zinc ribbon domain-containing protein [Couchioplanes caeruleus subsp. azureus]